jgi:hypothetical protein
MSVRLLAVTSYVDAVKKSGMKNRSEVDYFNCLKSKLYHIQGNKVVFRTYMNDIEYWEYAFKRAGVGKIEYLYTTYGCEE